jgi:hypothetical protein
VAIGQTSAGNNLFPAIAAFLLMFSGVELYGRAAIELDGTVVSSNTSCMQPQNNRCATEYIVESTNRARTMYVAGSTDKALQRWLPVGTRIVKHKWAFAYSVNGKPIDDFGLAGYLCIFAFGLCVSRLHFVYRQNS